MNTDMRKWMDEAVRLAEPHDGWYTDEELMDKFIASANHEYWWETFIYVPAHEYLMYGQHAFQKFMRYQMKPAWISDVRIESSSPLISNQDGQEYPDGNIFWKVEQGEEDPDEY